MRRVYNPSSTDEEANAGPRNQVSAPQNHHRIGRGNPDSCWPASALSPRPAPRTNEPDLFIQTPTTLPSVRTDQGPPATRLVPGISIQTPTPSPPTRIDEGLPTRTTSAQSTEISSWSDHHAHRQYTRPVSQGLSQGEASASNTTASTRGLDALLLLPNNPVATRKRTLKVAFADSTDNSRNQSVSSDITVSDNPDLLHPSKARQQAQQNPFEDSFARATKDSGADSVMRGAKNRLHVSNTPRRTSDRGRLSADTTRFLRKVRRPSLAVSRRKGSGGSAGHGRARSMWIGRPHVRDPFRSRSHDGAEARPTVGRRRSEPDLRRPSAGGRRPSAMRRMSSYVVTENPIPRQYRTRSVASLSYFVNHMETNNRTIPIFGADIVSEKQNVEDFLAAVEILQAKAVRKPWHPFAFKTAYFGIILCVIYFVFVGQPLWDGVGLIMYRWVNSIGIGEAGSAIFMSWAAFQAIVPMLFVRFEQEVDDVEKRDASEVALVIPAYKAAKILPETIRHALKIFKPEQIFIMANGNSPTPMDDTADVCAEFGVNVAWVPVGSKIAAEFVGVALTSKYKYILLIDDDVHLPVNLPIVTDRIQGKTRCIGYTIKSTGENGCKGTIIQQCQDMEYKLSGHTRNFCGKYGSASFPHGAIILWDRQVLQDLFNVHPGYAISEDWFFGYAARASGYRIQFCSQVFVETETPPSLIFTTGPARGGFGEMTVFKQRFYRWNFFWAQRLWPDLVYMLFSWRLGWYEIVTKIWVVVELYDSVMAFLRPFLIVLGFMANWKLLLQFIAILSAMYIFAFVLFNSWHLRKKKEMVSWKILPAYIGMKFVLMWVNVASVYYGLYMYASYFSVSHPRVIESRKILEAAYSARLGPDLVPLDVTMGDATAAAEAAEAAGEAPGSGSPLDTVVSAVPLEGGRLLEAAQGIFGGFTSDFSFKKKEVASPIQEDIEPKSN